MWNDVPTAVRSQEPPAERCQHCRVFRSVSLSFCTSHIVKMSILLHLYQDVVLVDNDVSPREFGHYMKHKKKTLEAINRCTRCSSPHVVPRPVSAREPLRQTKSWRLLLLPVQLFTCPSLFQTCPGSWNILHTGRLFCWMLSKWHHANRCWPSIRHLRVTVSPTHSTHTHTHTHTSVTLYTPPTRSLLTHHWSHAAAAALSSVKFHADRRVRATRLNQRPVRRPQ